MMISHPIIPHTSRLAYNNITARKSPHSEIGGAQSCPPGVLGIRGFRGFWFSVFLDFQSGFLDFQSVLVSWLFVLCFQVSRMYQISISCFLEEIDLISKICKILVDGTAGLIGTRLFEMFKLLDFQNPEIHKNTIFDLFLGVLVSPKMKIVGFGARGHVQKSRNHRNEGFEVLP